MQFGVLLPNYGPTASLATLAQSARYAEELGFDSVWTTDHVLVHREQTIPYGNLIESLMALSIAATVTSKVKLGTSVIVVPQREPVLLAKQIAALDIMSGGRIIFGAGSGWMEREFQFLGADYTRRGKIFDESLQVMRALWKGQETFKGEFTSFEDAVFAPLPPQGANLPIWIGGNGKAGIDRAAKIGDAWHPVGIAPKELAEGAANLRAKAKAQGRQVMVAPRFNVSFSGAGGIGEQMSEASLAQSHILRGGTEEMARDITELQQAGLDYLVLFFFHADWKELEKFLVTFAEKVMPAFK